MPDREKVIKGFENCVFNYCDDDCIYKDEEWKASGFAACRHYAREDTVEIPKKVLLDVLELLKAQPRVMTLEEVQQHYSLPPIFPDDFGMQEDYYNDIEPLYFDFPRDDPYIVHWRGYNGVAVCLNEWKENYGKTWRCWTARPTKEQREAVPWGTAVNV